MAKNQTPITAALAQADTLTTQAALLFVKSLPWTLQTKFLYRTYELEFTPVAYSIENFRQVFIDELDETYGGSMWTHLSRVMLDHINFEAFATIVYEMSLKAEIDQSKKRYDEALEAQRKQEIADEVEIVYPDTEEEDEIPF